MENPDEKLSSLSVSELVDLVLLYRQKFKDAEERLKANETKIQSNEEKLNAIEERVRNLLKHLAEQSEKVTNEEVNKLSGIITKTADALSKLYGGSNWKRVNSDEEYLRVLNSKANQLGDTNELWAIVDSSHPDGYKCIIGGNYFNAVLDYWNEYEGLNFKGSIFDYADDAFQNGEAITDEAMLDSIMDIVDSNNIIKKVSKLNLVPA